MSPDLLSTGAMVLRIDVLRSLHAMLGARKSADFVASFRTELASKLDEIERNRGVPAVVASASHKLVGISGALGLEELSLACQALSASAKRNQQGLFGLIENVQTASQRAMRALDLETRLISGLDGF